MLATKTLIDALLVSLLATTPGKAVLVNDGAPNICVAEIPICKKTPIKPLCTKYDTRAVVRPFCQLSSSLGE